VSTTALAVAAVFSILVQGSSPATGNGSDRYAEVGDCLRGVATQYSAEAFDTIVDRAVERCGAMIPFPVPPRIHRGSYSAPAAVEPDHTQVIRRHIAFRLRQIMKADASQGHAPP
jgi:hypothetical protein